MSHVSDGDSAQYTRAASPPVPLGMWQDGGRSTNHTDTKTSVPNNDDHVNQGTNRSKSAPESTNASHADGMPPSRDAAPASSSGAADGFQAPIPLPPTSSSPAHIMSAAPYPGMPDPYYDPGLYTQQANPSDQPQYPRYYYYGYVTHDTMMGYPRSYSTDPSLYPPSLYSRRDDNDHNLGETPSGSHEPPATQPPLNAVPMSVSYSIPIYQRPVYYPNAPMVGHFPYPPAVRPAVTPEGVPNDPAYPHTPSASVNLSPSLTGHQYANPYEAHHHAKQMYMPPPTAAPGYPPMMYSDAGAPYYGYSPQGPIMPSQFMGQYPMVPRYSPAPMEQTSAPNEARPRRSTGTWGSGRGRRGSNRRYSSTSHQSASTPADSHNAPKPQAVPAPSSDPPVHAKVSTGPAESTRTTASPEQGVSPEIHTAEASSVPSHGAVSEDQRQGTRSNYVMWCGNVPSDATLDELWKFFSSVPDDFTGSSSEQSSASPGSVRDVDPIAERAPTPGNASEDAPSDSSSGRRAGILSIFIMSRSSCAFVNYVSGFDLDRACAYFHGKPLRLKSSCPRLVCRPRRLEDAEYAGVAAQRGKGVHTNWYRQQRQQQLQRQRQQSESGDALPADARGDNTTEDNATGMSDSRSFTSTNSSLLRQPMFAHRFFILKSRNSDALTTALRTNIWSTQSHNEPVLDQAFRNSAVVTLLFSENFSGQFFGYATMSSRIGGALPGANTASPVRRADRDENGVGQPVLDHPLPKDTDDVAVDKARQAAPGDSPTLFSRSPKMDTAALHSVANGSPDRTDTKEEKESNPSSIDSSISATPSMNAEREANEEWATNAKLHNRRLDVFDAQFAPDESDEIRDKQEGHTPARAETTLGPSHAQDRDQALEPTSCAAEQRDGAPGPKELPDSIHDTKSTQLGLPFYISWKITKPLPFSEIQTLRNPWRDNRLVKVSRDGTELEPNVGKQLIKIWEAYSKPTSEKDPGLEGRS